MIKVIIVDDHKLFRQGLAVMLASKEGIEVVERFESAIALLDQLPNIKADLILLDIDMPELDGISALPKIKKISRKVKVAILSMHLNSAKIKAALDAGANGYMLKSGSDEEVARGIQEIIDGKQFIAKAAEAELEVAETDGEVDPTQLTQRERDILQLVCKEMNSQEIAKRLNISKFTADTHRKNLLNKTGCKNSVGLVKYAMRNKLIQ